MPKETNQEPAGIGDNAPPFDVPMDDFIGAWNQEHELQAKAQAIASERKKFHGKLKAMGIKVVDWKTFLRLDSLSRPERAHFDAMRAKFETYLRRKPGTQIEMLIDDDDLSDEELEAQELQRAEEDGWNAGLKGQADENSHNYSPNTPAANAFVGAWREAQQTLVNRFSGGSEAGEAPPEDVMTDHDFDDDDFGDEEPDDESEFEDPAQDEAESAPSVR